MIRLMSILMEASKIKPMTSNLGPLYHGTAFGKEIGKGEFKVSTSGFGQRGLAGLALTPDEKVAWEYAKSHAKYTAGAGKPEVMVVDIGGTQLADLRNTSDEYDIWVKLGYDPMKDEYDKKYIHTLKDKYGPLAVTTLLKKQGFGGAVVDNTLHQHSSPEVCIFDPKSVRITGRRLSAEDYQG